MERIGCLQLYRGLKLLLILFFVLPGCSNDDKKVEETPLPGAAIVTLSATPDNYFLDGESQLLAEFNNGSGSIEPDVGAVESGVPVTVSPIKTTTYTLSVLGQDGKTVQQNVTVTVGQLQSPVFFVRRSAQTLTQSDPRNNALFSPGGDLFMKMPGQDPVNITRSITAEVKDAAGNVIKTAGDVKSPSVNYNGTKIVFSLHEGLVAGTQNQNTWDLWEYEFADSTGNGNFTPILRPLIDTPPARSLGDDLDPSYLPDGRIVFTSDRQHLQRARFVSLGNANLPYRDENRYEPALNLHVIDGTGSTSSIQQISFNTADERNPTVLADGFIGFSRWELSREGGRDQFDLFKVRADGSGLSLLYGAHSHGTIPRNTVIVHPKPLPDGRLLAVMTSYNQYDPNNPNGNDSNLGGGKLVSVDINGYIDIDTPRAGGAALQSAGHQTLTEGVLSEPGLSLAGRYQNHSPIWQGSDTALRTMVSWSACRVVDRTDPLNPVYSVCDNGGESSDPSYGLYIFNINSKTLTPFLEPPADNGVYVDPVVAIDRSQFNSAVPQLAVNNNVDSVMAANSVGAIHVRSVYDSNMLNSLIVNNLPRGTSLPLMADGRGNIEELVRSASTSTDTLPVRFMRIISPMPTYSSTQVAAHQYGANGRRMRAILGYAAVEPDGSTLVEIPANVPFAIELVDSQGTTFKGQHKNWMMLAPGETLSCNGCHEGHSEVELSTLNTGFSTTTYNGAISLQLQASMDANIIAQVQGGETMAELRSRFDPLSLKLDRDPSWFDYYWANSPTIALEYNDSNLANGNDGLSGNAPIRPSSCAPQNFTDPTDQPVWKPECIILINYLTHIQPLWERQRLDALGQDATCVACHNSKDAVGFDQIPAGSTQLDLSTNGPQFFTGNANPNYVTSYNKLFIQSQEVTLDTNGVLVGVTDSVPVSDGNGGTIIVEVPRSAGGTPAIGIGREARITQLIRLLSGELGTPTVDHSQLMTKAERRLLSEWIDLGAQYYNDSSLVLQ